MTDVNDLRKGLVGDSGTTITLAFVLAIRSFVRWPVDFFAIETNEDNKVRTLYWLQGDAFGRLTAEGPDDSPAISGLVRSVADITAVALSATVIDKDFGPGEVERAISVSFGTGEDIRIDVAGYRNQHFRDRANEFIDDILSFVAGEDLTDEEGEDDDTD